MVLGTSTTDRLHGIKKLQFAALSALHMMPFLKSESGSAVNSNSKADSTESGLLATANNLLKTMHGSITARFFPFSYDVPAVMPYFEQLTSFEFAFR